MVNNNAYCITDDSFQIKDDFILLDTNIIIDITGYDNATNPRVQETKDFLTKLSQNNVIGVITTKTWEELNIIVERNIIGNKHKNPNINLDPLINQVDITMNNIENALNTFPNIYTEPIGSIDVDTLNKSKINRSKFNLRWADSIILAIAQQNEIKNILTMDKDYLKVNDGSINIFVDSHTYSNLSNNNNTTSVVNNSTNIITNK